MKIISLSSSIAGPACAIGICIRKHFYNNNYQTNMFDYLEISLLSIIQILFLNDGDINYLHMNNEIFNNTDGNNSVIFKNFDKIISHHDLCLNYLDEDYKKFIDKYKRRYHRLIEYINTEDKIVFIRYGIEKNIEIQNFMKKINEINPKLEVYFINVNYDEKSEIINYNIKNVFYINFYDYLDVNITYNKNLFYKTMQYDWKIINDLINYLK
jgi:hypothetical protein